jgi:hypothetical protein
MGDITRLAPSFHQTFCPERQYLSRLLEFAASVGIGSIAEISEATGIPTGASSGKVEPIICYAKGMGLVGCETVRAGVLALHPTPLCRAILKEDRHLVEESTQWALHLMLCRRHGGAEIWNAVFVEGGIALGREFTRKDLDSFLINRYGGRSDLIGPLLRTYSDPAALARVGALIEDGKLIRRKQMPNQPALTDVFATLLMICWDNLLAEEIQVSLRDLEAETGLVTATGWNDEDISALITGMEAAGNLRVDRQTGHPILTRTARTEEVLERMYERLV